MRVGPRFVFQLIVFTGVICVMFSLDLWWSRSGVTVLPQSFPICVCLFGSPKIGSPIYHDSGLIIIRAKQSEVYGVCVFADASSSGNTYPNLFVGCLWGVGFMRLAGSSPPFSLMCLGSPYGITFLVVDSTFFVVAGTD